MATSPTKTRKYPRVTTDLKVQVKPSREFVMLDAKVSTLGEGGVLLETDRNFTIGNDLMMTFYLPMSSKGKYCLVTGRVVSINKNTTTGKIGYGIAFDRSSPSLTKILHDYVTLALAKVASTHN